MSERLKVVQMGNVKLCFAYAHEVVNGFWEKHDIFSVAIIDESAGRKYSYTPYEIDALQYGVDVTLEQFEASHELPEKRMGKKARELRWHNYLVAVLERVHDINPHKPRV